MMANDPRDGASPDRVQVGQKRRLPLLPILLAIAAFIAAAVYFGTRHDRQTRVADATAAAPGPIAAPPSPYDPAAGPTPQSQEATKGRDVQGGPGSGSGLQRTEKGL